MEHSILHSTSFWYAASFILFFVLAGKALSKAITGWLDSKIGTIKAGIDEAAKLRAEAEHLLQQAKARHAAASAEADALVAAATASAAKIRSDVEAETQKLIARREVQVTERIAQAEKQALTDIQAQTVRLAIKLAHDQLAALPADTRAQLTASAITDIGKAA